MSVGLKRVKTVLKIVAVLLIVIITAVNNINKSEAKFDFVEFINVGQGDCALIYSNGYSALIDVGTPTAATAIAKELRRHNIDTVDVIIISHPHDDHIGSAEFILEEFTVNNILFSSAVPADDQNAQTLKNIKDTAEFVGTECHYAQEGMVINIGNFELTVLLSDETAQEENDTSIVLMAENDGCKFLFTGDAEEYCEQKLIDENINFNCDVLKVGHHGSNTSTTEEFLDISSPMYSVISVGRTNSYGHPTDEVLARLKNSGTEVFRTDVSGNITAKVVEGKIVIE